MLCFILSYVVWKQSQPGGSGGEVRKADFLIEYLINVRKRNSEKRHCRDLVTIFMKNIFKNLINQYARLCEISLEKCPFNFFIYLLNYDH